MLILSRKKNEKIVIGDNIAIVIVEIRGDKARIGIEAPKEVPVHRQEVADQIKKRAGQAAAAAVAEAANRTSPPGGLFHAP